MCPARPGRGSSTDVLSENCQNRYQRREPRPPKSLGDPLYEPARIGPRAGRPAMNSFSGRPSHPKPEGRQRSHIGSARSANARFFGRATVPSAVTSAAPGGWRVAWRRAAAVSILRAYWTDSSLPAATQRRRNRGPACKTGVSPICTGSDDSLVRGYAHDCVRSFPPMAEQAGS